MTREEIVAKSMEYELQVCGIHANQKIREAYIEGAMWILEKLEKENEQLKVQIEKMKCCKNCKKYRMPESQVTLLCLKNQRTNFCCEDWELA